MRYKLGEREKRDVSRTLPVASMTKASALYRLRTLNDGRVPVVKRRQIIVVVVPWW